jgi:hypothetical protein
MAGVPAKRGAAFDLVVVIRDADGDPITDPAGLAAVISKDTGAQAATTNTPAVVSAGSAMVKLALTAAEMTADIIAYLISSTTTGAKSAFGVIYTETSQIRDLEARLPAALVGGRVDANLGAINNQTAGVAAFERATQAIVTGTVAAGATSTVIPTSSMDPAITVADQLKGRVMLFPKDTATTGLRGQGGRIESNTSGGTITLMTEDALSVVPASGDKFVIQ